RQLVFTSDRPPGELADLEARLRERFECGLVVPVERPGVHAREGILRKRILHDRVQLGEDAICALAAGVDSSVRALEGALIRVVAYSSLRGESITADTVDSVLGRLPRASDQPPGAATLESIQAATAEAYGISRDRLLARDRSPHVALARQVAMYLARELTNATLPAIGRGFARNHATVIHAHRRVAEDVAAGGPASATVDMLRTRLASRSE